MELIIIGGGIGGLTLALAAHAAKAAARIRVFEAAPGYPPARGRDQSRAACGEGAEPARAAGRARRGRLPAAGLRLLHPPRPTRLPRAMGARGRASMAAFFHSSRRPASGPAGCRARAPRAAKLHHRPPLHRHRAKRCGASPRASSPRTAPRWSRSRATCWWHATASIRRCGRSSIRTKARSPIAASICGAA